MEDYQLPVVNRTMHIHIYHTRASFSALYEQTQLIVFRYIYALHGDPREEVEDIWLETYLRAWKGRYRFAGSEGAALGWLLKIARHLVIDKQRRRKFATTVLTDTLPAPLEETPEHCLVIKEELQTLTYLLESLTVQQREMIILRYVVGWRVNQIAQYLKMRENTVSVTLQRVLAKLASQAEDASLPSPSSPLASQTALFDKYGVDELNCVSPTQDSNQNPKE